VTQQIINIGAAPDDHTGDPLRTAFTKSNANFTELYTNTPVPLTVPLGGTGAANLPNLLPGGGQNPTSALMLTASGAATGPLRASPNLGTWGDASLTMVYWGYGPYIDSFMARGTSAAPTATQLGDNLFQLAARGRVSTTNWASTANAAINFNATENFSATTQGSSLTFLTTANGTATQSTKMTLDGVGNLTLAVPLAVPNGGTGVTSFVLPASGGLATARCLLYGLGTTMGSSAWGTYSDFVSLACYGAPNSAYIDMGGTTGTTTAPTATPSGHGLAAIIFNGYGTAWAAGAYIQAVTTELWGATAHGTALQWWTTANTTTANVNSMQLGNTFGLQVNLSPASMLPGLATAGDWAKGLIIQTNAGITSYLILDSDYNGSTVFCGRTYRGTATARTAVQSGDVMAAFGGTGHDGTNLTSGSWPRGALEVRAAENWIATATGTYMRIYNTTPGTTSSIESIRFGQGVMIGTTVDAGVGTIKAGGTNAAIWIEDRSNLSLTWGWYATGGSMRFYNGADRLTLDASGNLTVPGTISSGGDFVLSRTTNAWGYLIRPNTAGYKNIGLTCAGVVQLDNISLDAVQTQCTGTLLSTATGSSGQIRMAPNNAGTSYGSFFRNDGSSTYFMLTNNNDPYGTWNGLRPFIVDNASGNISFGHNVIITGNATCNSTLIGNVELLLNGTAQATGYITRPNTAGYKNIALSCTAGGSNLDNIYLYAGTTTCNGSLTVSNVVTANGYQAHEGLGSAIYQNNYFNIDWVGVAHLWIDGVNQGAISVSSDYRIKTNVVELPSMWSRIKALRPISYNLKDTEELLVKADPEERWGFIAHELQETLIKNAATGYKDAPNLVQSPNVMTLLAVLTKALQETMARVEALERTA
jgi:hypothetical protein